MKEAIASAVTIFRNSPDLDDEGVFRALVDKGVEPSLAARIVEFLPIAYCRLLLAKSGVQFSNSFTRAGSYREMLSLSSVPVWIPLLAYAESEIQRGAPSQEILIVAGRSAEFQAVNQMLDRKAELKSIVLASTLLPWPENGPDANKQRNSPARYGVCTSVKSPRIFRIAAICNWTIALLVGVLSGTELYVIRTGQFHNSNWLEPTSWARTQEWGLLFSLCCLISGYGLWNAKPWSRWAELLLVAPKVYCGYIEAWLFAMTRSPLFFIVVLLIFINVGITAFLWLLKLGIKSPASTRSG